MRLDLMRFLEGHTVRTRKSSFLRRLAAGLDRNPHPEEYQSWRKLLVWLAATNLAAQTVLFVCTVAQQELYFGPLVRATQLALMWGILWRFGGFAPRNASVSQRQVAAVCVGFLLACTACALGHWLRGELIADSALYVEWCTLSGFLFVVFGRLHWGWLYAFAGGFFALAIMAGPFGAPTILLFGLLWAAALLAAARRIQLNGGSACQSAGAALSVTCRACDR